MEVEKIMQALEQKHPGESEYLQAVHEVLMSVKDVYNQHPEFERASIIERIVEPERIITFRVPWVDDQGKVQVNIGYRVQFNGAIGPYKGGLRFHASVNLSILKFLGFEQTFQFQGMLTGKGREWGGSILRPEATGYGALYFVHQMMETHGLDIKGKTVAISGFGNVAWGAAKKATELGAKVITLSGPDGYIYDPDGISGEKIEYMLELRNSGNDVCEPYAEKYPGAKFFKGHKPWEQKADIYLPCATQNELNGEDADKILAFKPLCVAEVSNMGCTAEAAEKFTEAKQLFAPGKAVNAGGVATSGLEMSQNSLRLSWSPEEVDQKLHYIMSSIHEQCVKYGKQADGYIDYIKGANIAGFMKVAKAMLAQGVV